MQLNNQSTTIDETVNSSRYIALAVCMAVVAAIAVLLVFCRLEAPAAQPRFVAAALIVEEEVSAEGAQGSDRSDLSDQSDQSDVSDVSDQSDLADGAVGAVLEEVSLQAKAHDEATRDIAQAFKAAEDAKDGSSGGGSDAEEAAESSTAVSGSGQGSVGGGWIMPRYAKVSSTLTGRIELRATIDASGNVTRVVQTGGKAPAGTDAALVARCIAEVKSHRFTRNDDNAPTSATARIVYIFK